MTCSSGFNLLEATMFLLLIIILIILMVGGHFGYRREYYSGWGYGGIELILLILLILLIFRGGL